MKSAIMIDTENVEENQILKRIIGIEGVINIDLKDIKAVLGKKAFYGSGETIGIKNIKRAAREAIASIYFADENAFEVDRAIVYITAGEAIPLLAAAECVDIIKSFLEPDPDLRWGLGVDDSFKKDQILVEVILPAAHVTQSLT